MRRPTQIFIALVVANSLLGQGVLPIESKSLVGCWQSYSPEVSAGPTDCFRFFKDGRFSFEFSSYDETKRIESLHGTYSLGNGFISFVITSRVKRVGGRIQRSPESGNGWYLRGGRLVTVKQTKSKPDETTLEICSDVPQKPLCIKIGSDKYFQMSVNPKYKIGTE
jgi:hypothetical protein